MAISLPGESPYSDGRRRRKAALATGNANYLPPASAAGRSEMFQNIDGPRFGIFSAVGIVKSEADLDKLETGAS